MLQVAKRSFAKAYVIYQCNQTRIVEILRLILPQIAQRFFQQRGNIPIFGCGDFDKNSSKLITEQDFEKLDEVPIYNLDSEQSVGSINYELKICGTKQIFLGGFSLVKAKLRDLVELKPKEEFKKYYETSLDVSKIMDLWKTTQIELDKNKLSSKEAIQVQIDQHINKDLQYIKLCGGPFTAPKEVDHFFNQTEISLYAKQAVLYHHVRYCRDTCLSLAKSNELFRLRKNYNLALTVYSENSKIFLSKFAMFC